MSLRMPAPQEGPSTDGRSILDCRCATDNKLQGCFKLYYSGCIFFGIVTSLLRTALEQLHQNYTIGPWATRFLVTQRCSGQQVPIAWQPGTSVIGHILDRVLLLGTCGARRADVADVDPRRAQDPGDVVGGIQSLFPKLDPGARTIATFDGIPWSDI